MNVFHPSDLSWAVLIPLLVFSPLKHNAIKSKLLESQIQSAELEIKILEDILFFEGTQIHTLVSTNQFIELLEFAAHRLDSRAYDFVSDELMVIDVFNGKSKPAGFWVADRTKPNCREYRATRKRIDALQQQKNIFLILIWVSIVGSVFVFLYRIGWIKGLMTYLDTPSDST